MEDAYIAKRSDARYDKECELTAARELLEQCESLVKDIELVQLRLHRMTDVSDQGLFSIKFG